MLLLQRPHGARCARPDKTWTWDDLDEHASAIPGTSIQANEHFANPRHVPDCSPAGCSSCCAGLVYEWVDRKLVARFQNRIGPRWFQPLADMVKLLSKEEIIPEGVDRCLFIGLPIVALAGALTAALYVPVWRACSRPTASAAT